MYVKSISIIGLFCSLSRGLFTSIFFIQETGKYLLYKKVVNIKKFMVCFVRDLFFIFIFIIFLIIFEKTNIFFLYSLEDI